MHLSRNTFQVACLSLVLGSAILTPASQAQAESPLFGGTVRTAAGEIASNMQIDIVAAPSQDQSYRAGESVRMPDVATTRTDAQGNFTVPTTALSNLAAFTSNTSGVDLMVVVPDMPDVNFNVTAHNDGAREGRTHLSLSLSAARSDEGPMWVDLAPGKAHVRDANEVDVADEVKSHPDLKKAPATPYVAVEPVAPKPVDDSTGYYIVPSERTFDAVQTVGTISNSVAKLGGHFSVEYTSKSTMGVGWSASKGSSSFNASGSSVREFKNKFKWSYSGRTIQRNFTEWSYREKWVWRQAHKEVIKFIGTRLEAQNATGGVPGPLKASGFAGHDRKHCYYQAGVTWTTTNNKTTTWSGGVQLKGVSASLSTETNFETGLTELEANNGSTRMACGTRGAPGASTSGEILLKRSREDTGV